MDTIEIYDPSYSDDYGNYTDNDGYPDPGEIIGIIVAGYSHVACCFTGGNTLYCATGYTNLLIIDITNKADQRKRVVLEIYRTALLSLTDSPAVILNTDRRIYCRLLKEYYFISLLFQATERGTFLHFFHLSFPV